MWTSLALVCVWLTSCAGPQWRGKSSDIGPPSQIERGEARSNRYFVGYYRADNLVEGSILPLSRIRYDRFTHIIHIGLSFDEKGTWNTIEGQMPCSALPREAHEHGVLVLLSLVGNKKHFEAVAENEDRLIPFTESLIKMVYDNHYDGIDVDWEHPASEEAGKGWMRMMRSLREKLDKLGKEVKRKYWLTTALPAGWSGEYLNGEMMTETLDFLNVMCYDGFGPWGGLAGNHAPLFPAREDPRRLSMDKGISYWRDQVGVPAEKLAMGLPFYAYVCRGYKPYESIVPGAKGKSVDGGSTWAGIHALIENEGWERRFDEASQSAWYFSPDGKAFVAADDPEIIRIKTIWAKDQGFRGVFMWSMRCDVMSDGSTPLLDAMYEAWTEKDSPAESF